MTRILVIDDQPSIRKRIAEFLNKTFAIDICSALTTSQFPKFILKNPGSYLIIADPTSSDDVVNLKALSPDSKILIYTARKHTEFDLLDCLSVGACGYLSKDTRASKFLTAILTIIRGEPYLPSNVKTDLVKILRKRAGLRLSKGQIQHSSKQIEPGRARSGV